MYKKVIKFDHTEIGDYGFHQYKRPDINKIIVSNKLSFST